MKQSQSLSDYEQNSTQSRDLMVKKKKSVRASREGSSKIASVSKISKNFYSLEDNN